MMTLALPNSLSAGAPGSGQFTGIVPSPGRHCHQRVALLLPEEPLLDSQERALLALARQLNVPACIDLEHSLKQVWPEIRRWARGQDFWNSLAHSHG